MQARCHVRLPPNKPPTAQVHYIEGDSTQDDLDFAPDWTEDTLQTKVNNKDYTDAGTPNSIHALLHMQGLINKSEVSVLHDDGGSHDFIS